MSARRRPTFLQGVLIALILACAGAALIVALAGVFGSLSSVRFVMAASAGAYVVYLLAFGGRGAGRATLALFWLFCACVIGVFVKSLAMTLIAHAGLVWFVRSVLFHRSILSAGADLVLSALAVAVACWAALGTHSAWLTSWSFFLVQALFVAIPASLAGHARATAEAPVDNFTRAEQAAVSALRRYAGAL